MSTRSHILIEGHKAALYRHCDGYPGTPDGAEYGVLADIIPFLTKFMNGRGWDPEYLLARTVHHLIQSHEPEGFLGYGIDTATHGDEEFIYVIKRDRKVEVRVPNREFWNTPRLENTTLREDVPF